MDRHLLSGLIFLQQLIVGSHFPPETYLRILTRTYCWVSFSSRNLLSGHIFLQKLICVFLRAECNTLCSIVWAGAMVFHCRRSTCSNRVRRRRAACSEHQQVRQSVRTLEPHGDVGNGTRGSPCSAHQGVGMGRHKVRGPTATSGLLIPPHSAATPASVQGPDLP